MFERTGNYDVDELESFLQKCRDAGLIGKPLANSIGVAESTVTRGRREGMANRESWRMAVSRWVDRLYAESEEARKDLAFEFLVKGDVKSVDLPARLSVEPIQPQPQPQPPVATDSNPIAPRDNFDEWDDEVEEVEEGSVRQDEWDDELEEVKEEKKDGLFDSLESEFNPASPWGDPDRFDENFVSASLKEKFDADFEGDGDGGVDGIGPDWRLDGVPIAPPPDLLARYGDVEKARKVWMYRQVCWTAGLAKSHLGLGYSEEACRLLHRFELELALELMDEFGMTADPAAELPWTADKRLEMVELQRRVIKQYDEVVEGFKPRGALGFGIKALLWLDSLINRRKRREIAEKWGMNP